MRVVAKHVIAFWAAVWVLLQSLGLSLELVACERDAFGFKKTVIADRRGLHESERLHAATNDSAHHIRRYRLSRLIALELLTFHPSLCALDSCRSDVLSPRAWQDIRLRVSE